MNPEKSSLYADYLYTHAFISCLDFCVIFTREANLTRPLKTDLIGVLRKVKAAPRASQVSPNSLPCKDCVGLMLLNISDQTRSGGTVDWDSIQCHRTIASNRYHRMLRLAKLH